MHAASKLHQTNKSCEAGQLQVKLQQPRDRTHNSSFCILHILQYTSNVSPFHVEACLPPCVPASWRVHTWKLSVRHGTLIVKRCSLLADSSIIVPADLSPPNPSQSVYREDCTQCFDSIVRQMEPSGWRLADPPGRPRRPRRLPPMLQRWLRWQQPPWPRTCHRAPSSLCTQYSTNTQND